MQLQTRGGRHYVSCAFLLCQAKWSDLDQGFQCKPHILNTEKEIQNYIMLSNSRLVMATLRSPRTCEKVYFSP